MANIEFPIKFDEILSTNQEILGIVKKTAFDFGEILSEKKLFFFEEYTDHGISHIEKVLFGAHKLITDETYKEILNPEDIGFYSLSVFLHDIGMHITFEGFQSIISGYHDSVLVEHFDNKNWGDLWQEYLSEARRFSGKQLYLIFGDEDVEIRNPLILKKGEINGNDRKLIGEFIRRYHPRLAHEIALIGFPCTNNTSIEFAKGLDLKKRNLIGLIARSHGINLRKCVEFLESEYGNSRRVPLGVHVNYLMILLRISDYLQIDKSRTSKIILKTKKFDSPVSQIEHNSHLSIEHIDDKYQDDPERIYITASPDDSNMYLKLKKLFRSIQQELDVSWAVLGELYGNLEKKPTIKYRRITSNLDDETFIDKQEYLGDYFTFKSNDEIIKLLIAPLYGNHPKYGVRELLQNSVDACNERKLDETNDYKTKISIEVNKQGEEFIFSISDNGKGMNIDEIKNYFLSAGASYRQSREWKQKFINDEGNSKIQRNGRFGIGILASFLIGKNIEVSTRQKNSQNGYYFNANLNSSQINVLKKNNLEIGTTIKIKINEGTYNLFSHLKRKRNYEFLWIDWYTLKEPEILYLVDGKRVENYRKKDPSYLDNELPIDWHEIDSKGYNKILWSYDNSYSGKKVVVNGIVVEDPFPYTGKYKILDLKYITTKPNLLIFDNNGITPISLDRNEITDSLTFNQDLSKSIYKDFIAFILTKKDITQINNSKIIYKSQILGYPGLSNYYLNTISHGFGEKAYDISNKDLFQNLTDEYLVSKDGYIVNYNYFLMNIGVKDLVYLQSDKLNYDDILELDIKDSFILINNNKLNSIDDYKTALIKNNRQPYYINSRGNKDYDSWIYIKSQKFNYLFLEKKGRLPNWLFEKYNNDIESYNDWNIIKVDKPTNSIILKKMLDKYPDKINFIRQTPINCQYKGDTIFNDLLNKYLGTDVVIPFDITERKKKYPLAFKDLEKYMKKYI